MDKIRFQPQERLDLVDANALQELVYKYMGEALGGLMGNAGGALTTIEYTSTENAGTYTISLKPFQYYWCQPEQIMEVTRPDGSKRDVPKRYSGMVVSFDPADEGQVETLDWTWARNIWKNTAQAGDNNQGDPWEQVHGGYKPNNSFLMPILWARPYFTDTDIDARREWNVAAQAELPISMKTRTRTRTELKFQNNRPVVDPAEDNQNQWVPIGRVAAWNYDTQTQNANGAYIPDAFYLAPIYCWDSHFAHGDVEAQAGGAENPAGPHGEGVARFQGEDGAKGDQFANASVKNAGGEPGFTDSRWSENAPFENDGSVSSVLARGDWLPGTKNRTGGYGNGTHPTRLGGSDAQWPYPGSYYRYWNPALYTDDVTGTTYGGLELGWLSLEEEGFQVSTTPLWRMGVPQLMHLMRRQLALILDSGVPTVKFDGEDQNSGGRPWYAAPNDIGGLVQHKHEIEKNKHDIEDLSIHASQHLRFDEEDPAVAIRGCFVAAACVISGIDGTHAEVTSGWGLEKEGGSQNNSSTNRAQWRIATSGSYKIVSIAVTPHRKEGDVVTSGLNQYMVRITGNKTFNIEAYRLSTITESNSTTSQVIDIGWRWREDYGGELYTGASNTHWWLAGGGTNSWTTDETVEGHSQNGQVGNLCVDFGNMCKVKDVDHEYHVVVYAEKVV